MRLAFLHYWGRFSMTDIDARLDRMIEIAMGESLPLDHVVACMGRCSQTEFDTLSESPSRLPRYTKSSVRP